MPDRKMVIKGLKCIVDGDVRCECCGYAIDKHGHYSCQQECAKDAINLLKEQETTNTGTERIFGCEKCGYGIVDIFLNSESKYDIVPKYCPNCGRVVKWNDGQYIAGRKQD